MEDDCVRRVPAARRRRSRGVAGGRRAAQAPAACARESRASISAAYVPAPSSAAPPAASDTSWRIRPGPRGARRAAGVARAVAETMTEPEIELRWPSIDSGGMARARPRPRACRRRRLRRLHGCPLRPPTEPPRRGAPLRPAAVLGLHVISASRSPASPGSSSAPPPTSVDASAKRPPIGARVRGPPGAKDGESERPQTRRDGAALLLGVRRCRARPVASSAAGTYD